MENSPSNKNLAKKEKESRAIQKTFFIIAHLLSLAVLLASLCLVASTTKKHSEMTTYFIDMTAIVVVLSQKHSLTCAGKCNCSCRAWQMSQVATLFFVFFS